MKKRYLVLSIGAGFAGGVLSTSLHPVTARAQSQLLDEIKAQRFTLVNQNGAPMGSFSFDDSGRPQIILRDSLGHDVWRFVADHAADHSGDQRVRDGRFYSK